jgi:hypothetical protein
MNRAKKFLCVLVFGTACLVPAWAQPGSGTPLPGKPVDRVELPGASGVYVSGYSWATPYFLMVDGVPLRLVAYTGGVMNETAHGLGMLTTGQPKPELPSGGGGPVAVGYDNPFGEPGFAFEGRFVEGRVAGKGALFSRMTHQMLQGQFLGDFEINGQGVLSMDDKPLVIANYANGEMVDGPYRRYLYTPSGNGPTHEYIGTRIGGFVQGGTWKALDWTEQGGNLTVSFKDGKFVTQRVGEATITCTPLSTDPLPAPMIAPAKDIKEALDARNDPTVTPREVRCEEPVGTRGRIVYKVSKTATGTVITPESCSNAAGKEGKLTLGKDVLTCTTFGQRQGRIADPLSDMWKQLKKLF